jgi:hypothetical protein
VKVETSLSYGRRKSGFDPQVSSSSLK